MKLKIYTCTHCFDRGFTQPVYLDGEYEDCQHCIKNNKKVINCEKCGCLLENNETGVCSSCYGELVGVQNHH